MMNVDWLRGLFFVPALKFKFYQAYESQTLCRNTTN